MKTATTAATSIPLNGSDVVLFKTKKGVTKTYSARYLNESYGYFLVPIDNPDYDLGFWAKFDSCKILVN